MKKILLTLLLLPGISFAKSYVIDMKVCDTNTNCMKCYETVQVTYIVDDKSKKVTISGKDVNDKVVSEILDNCKISDVKNWSCESAFMTTQARNGSVKLMNKTNSNLASGKKEVCLVK